MIIDKWHSFLNWMADHGILFSAIVNLLITFAGFKLKIGDATLRKLINWVIVLTVLISLEYYLIQISYFPYTMIPVIGIIVTLFVSRSKNQIMLKRYTLILYSFFSIAFIYGIYLSMAKMTNWGSSTIFAGVFMIVHILPLLQLLRITYRQDKIYGILKLSTGILALLMVLIFGLRLYENDGETVALIQKSLKILIASTIIEGFLLILSSRAILLQPKEG